MLWAPFLALLFLSPSLRATWIWGTEILSSSVLFSEGLELSHLEKHLGKKRNNILRSSSFFNISKSRAQHQ